MLPKESKDEHSTSSIHGILGVHAGDGLGGGDEVFNQAIKNLERRFPFGSQRAGSFTFTGIHAQQSHNGDITLSQKDYYINDIPPININEIDVKILNYPSPKMNSKVFEDS